jgi:hypothetical protein
MKFNNLSCNNLSSKTDHKTSQGDMQTSPVERQKALHAVCLCSGCSMLVLPVLVVFYLQNISLLWLFGLLAPVVIVWFSCCVWLNIEDNNIRAEPHTTSVLEGRLPWKYLDLTPHEQLDLLLFHLFQTFMRAGESQVFLRLHWRRIISSHLGYYQIASIVVMPPGKKE